MKPVDPSTLDAKRLEAAVPTLAQKLKDMQKQLSPDEIAVFSSIVNSAALHLKSIHAIEDTAEVRYAKPISAAATVGVRKGLLDLPDNLGLNK